MLPACWLQTLAKTTDLLLLPFARNNAKIVGNMLAALDIKERHKQQGKSHY
jgi:hypothetical protein